jgi:hypothetical protein
MMMLMLMLMALSMMIPIDENVVDGLDLLHKSGKSRRFHARPHGTWFLNVQNHRIVCLSLLWVCYLFQFAKEYGCGVIST